MTPEEIKLAAKLLREYEDIDDAITWLNSLSIGTKLTISNGTYSSLSGNRTACYVNCPRDLASGLHSRLEYLRSELFKLDVDVLND